MARPSPREGAAAVGCFSPPSPIPAAVEVVVAVKLGSFSPDEACEEVCWPSPRPTPAPRSVVVVLVGFTAAVVVAA